MTKAKAKPRSRIRPQPAWRRAIGTAMQAGRHRVRTFLLPYQQSASGGDWRDTLAAVLDVGRRRTMVGVLAVSRRGNDWIEGRDGSGAAPPSVLSLRRHLLAGIAFCFLLIVGFGGWAATAELTGAVIAPASFVVESSVKKIQHPTGGVVGEINVKNGDLVRAEQVILRLDETVLKSNLSVVTKQLDEYTGRKARLEAEHSGAEALDFPEEFLARVGSETAVRKIVDGERRLFEDQRSARTSQKDQLTERIAQLHSEITGLESQKGAKEQQMASIEDEIKGVQDLFDKKLVPIARIATLRREAARLLGEHGLHLGSIAQAKGKIAETELQRLQIDKDARAEALKELREIEGKMGELAERKISSTDELRRVDVRSPQDGTVHELSVHTVGGVIKAGDTLMLIVPRADNLTIDGKILPQDRDQIAVGQKGFVRLPAFNQRTTPELKATVIRVAADVTREETSGAQYYMVRVQLDAGEQERLGDLKLFPGMPAELHIGTGQRTAMSYLLKPLTDQFTRIFKEE